jgi:hypothetical protein
MRAEHARPRFSLYYHTATFLLYVAMYEYMVGSQKLSWCEETGMGYRWIHRSTQHPTWWCYLVLRDLAEMHGSCET